MDIPIKKLKKKLNKNNYRLFQYILYQQNKNKINNYFSLNNNSIFKDKSFREKPIVIEHFINKENDKEYDYIYLNNINNKSSYSKKYYNLDFNFKDKNYISRNSISSKNSRINLSSLLSEIYYKKNFNKEGILQNENNINLALSNDYENNDFLFFNKNIHELVKKSNKKNKFNFGLFPKRRFNKLSNRKNLINEINKKETLNINQDYKKRQFMFGKKMRNNSCFFENKKTLKISNDMSQRNRFNKMKKDLTEEKNKINNMISEFFKGPLYNKFNKIDKIEDLKLKNSLKRPKSALSL